jgi:hypothetical protein
MATITGDATGEREPMATKQISTAQRSRMRARRVSGGEPESHWGFVLLSKHALSAPIQSVSFWSHADLRLLNREDIV